MANFIIGTAGHIDHGKSALIKALTNIETDRFDEEQERGITIDLGFAYLNLPDGNKIGIIDVPGHEKFIKNMLAGVSGVDLVLLIVAADESIMPQTKEHIDILRYLNIENGIICITKKDLVEKDFIELVKEDVKDYVKGTIFEGAPIVETSAVSLEGIDKLRSIIIDKYKNKQTSKDFSNFRMPIDRSFSIKGLGTIVTGTLVEGSIEVNNEIEIFPSHLITKARSIQVHNEDVSTAYAGQRVAINLPGIDKEEISRGDVLAPKDTYEETDLIDVELNLLKSSNRIVEHNTRLRLYLGTVEVMCRVNLLDKEVILPGETALVQLKLENKIVCKYNDPFVIRFYSPLETIGGGKVLKSKTRYHKSFDSKVIEMLEIIQKGNKVNIIKNYLLNNFYCKNTVDLISKNTGIDKIKVKDSIDKLLSNNEIIEINNNYYSSDYLEKIKDQMINFLNDYHINNPLHSGINKEEIRTKIFKSIDKNIFDSFLEIYNKKEIIIDESMVSLTDFEISYKEDEEKIYNKLLDYYYKEKYNPSKLKDVFDELNIDKKYEIIYINLLKEKKLIRLSQSITLHKKHLDNAEKLLVDYLKENNTISLGEYRDLINSSRKIVMPILEYFDSIQLTVREGNTRRLKGE